MRTQWICAALGAAAMLMIPACTPPAAEFRTVSHEGVVFIYSLRDFTACGIKAEPRLTSRENGDGVPVEVFPARITFELKDRRPLTAWAPGARNLSPVNSAITVIPLRDSTVEDFAAAYPNLAVRARRLEAVLRARPALPEKRAELPDLGEIDCEREIVAKPQFVDFHGGSGMLFLTQYVQEFRGINNEELACVFQGMTADGRFYISARFAAAHPALPKDIDAVKPVPTARQAQYLKRVETELDHFPGNSFQPSLEDIKALLASLTIGGAASQPAHPSGARAAEEPSAP